MLSNVTRILQRRVDVGETKGKTERTIKKKHFIPSNELSELVTVPIIIIIKGKVFVFW